MIAYDFSDNYDRCSTETLYDLFLHIFVHFGGTSNLYLVDWFFGFSDRVSCDYDQEPFLKFTSKFQYIA